MRLIKDEFEIKLLKQSAKIASQAHLRAMKMCKPSMYEYQLAAEVTHEFYNNGACDQAFGLIVAGGANANILHYTK